MKLLEFSCGPLSSITALYVLMCISGKTIHGLNCYQCSWSSNPEEYHKDNVEAATSQLQMADPKRQLHRENPRAKLYIGDKIRSVPSSEEVMNLCDEKECLSSDNVCMKWTYLSNTPINITYMCVNSKTTSGCYYQDVETNAGKQHLKLEVCLCESNLCNIAVSHNHCNKVLLLLASLLTVLLNGLKS